VNLDSSLETSLLRPEAIAGGVSTISDGIVSTIKAPEDAVSDPGGPPIWRLRNKIDLLTTPEPRSGPPDPKNEFYSHLVGRNDGSHISSSPTLTVVNQPLAPSNESVFIKSEHIFSISATSGAGFDRLMADLISAAESLLSQGESALITRERHRRSLADTHYALKRANDEPLSEEILAEELRAAGHELGRLTGRVDIEEILDVIFRDFCIGK
jgi:tRNA U34 5-carboxymethylaminomethyl modifying GTPase MnmE/TrmE